MGMWASLFGADDTSKGQELDAKLAAMNKQRLESGGYTQEQYDLAESNREKGAAVDSDLAVADGFNEGLKEGAKNVTKTISSIGGFIGQGVDATAKGLLQGIWRAIPWYLWLALAGVAFFYLGGGVIVRNVIKKHAN